jgi:predicted transcriptional regulator
MKMGRYGIETYFTNDNHLARYLLLLMNFDVMSSNQIADILGQSQSTTQKYLSSIKSFGLIMDLRVGRIAYWHLLPLGVHELERLLGKTFKTDATTIRSVQKIRSALSHDATCTDLIMSGIQRNEIFGWMGPTMTRRLYTHQRSGENRQHVDYNPDAIISLFGLNGLGGKVHVELDNSNQPPHKLMEKIRKARSRFIQDSLSNQIIAFVTSRSDDRAWNIARAAEKFNLDEPDKSLKILVISTTVEQVMADGFVHSPWFTNTGSDTQHFLHEYMDEPLGEDVIAIASDLWKEAYNGNPSDVLKIPRKAFK